MKRSKNTQSLCETAFALCVVLTCMNAWAAMDQLSTEPLTTAFVFGAAGLLFAYLSEE